MRRGRVRLRDGVLSRHHAIAQHKQLKQPAEKS